MSSSVSDQLRDAIRDGTFPDSEDILSSELTSDTVTRLLQIISQTKQELTEEIKESSRAQAGDVDEWISQAKRVQEDIVRCKNEARQIVQEHEKIEALRSDAREARHKEELLEEEIKFTTSLTSEIQTVAEISQRLGKVDSEIVTGDYLSAARGLSQSSSLINGVASSQTRNILAEARHDLEQKVQIQLAEALSDRIVVRREGEQSTLAIYQDGTSSPSVSKDSKQQISTSDLFEAFDNLDKIEDANSICSRRLEGFLLPHFSRNSELKTVFASRKGPNLELKLTVHDPKASQVASVIVDVIEYLFERLPRKGQHQVISKFVLKLVPIYVSEWLDAEIPIEVSDLNNLRNLQDFVSQLAQKLESWKLPGSEDLHRYINQIPRTWLAKRRMHSLDAVRKAFTQAKGLTRQVERVEKQVVPVEPPQETGSNEVDDWNADWDDEEEADSTKPPPAKVSEDDDADAWGFDDSEEQTQKTMNGDDKSDHEDDADAWGWGDENENPAEEKKPPTSNKQQTKSNGIKAEKPPQEQELVLRENYAITDIPDYILELVGKDMQDVRDLESTTASSFPPLANFAASLANIPTLSLAMFRAIAPNSYTQITPSSDSPIPLSYMNLYNDCLYLSSTLASNFPDSQLSTEAMTTLTKFARSHYSQAMEVQRTILTDLLDNAQGFVSCTRPPYADECTLAVASTVDRLRAVHAEWSAILSPSHCQQAVGALLNTVIAKLIKDIEDMEDISEPESRRLHQLCEDVSALQDLFSSRPVPAAAAADAAIPGAAGQETGEREDELGTMSSSVAIYVPSWLRFQYLLQILDSSLVDIKYMWTDAGLALEFSPDEVVDLIKALFAESSHRRNAIAAVKA